MEKSNLGLAHRFAEVPKGAHEQWGRTGDTEVCAGLGHPGGFR